MKDTIENGLDIKKAVSTSDIIPTVTDDMSGKDGDELQEVSLENGSLEGDEEEETKAPTPPTKDTASPTAVNKGEAGESTEEGGAEGAMPPPKGTSSISSIVMASEKVGESDGECMQA